MQNAQTYEMLGLKFTLVRDECKVNSLTEMPNVIFFRDQSLGEIPFSLIVAPSDDNDSLMNTRALFDNEVITAICREVGKWLTNLGYEDFTGAYDRGGDLEKVVRNARWDLNEMMINRIDPEHCRARLGKLNPETSKLFGDMVINPSLKVIMYRKASKQAAMAYHPVGKWFCADEEGYVFVNCNFGSNPANWFVHHLPEDLSQLEEDLASEFSQRWSKYPPCTFKLFTPDERKSHYYQLTKLK